MIFTCPSCNSKFRSDISGVVICPGCNTNVRVEMPPNEGCAWDRARKGEWVRAFYESVKLSLSNPAAFFSEVGAGHGWMRPWCYSLIAFLVVFVSAAAYQAGFQALAVGINFSALFPQLAFPVGALSFPLAVTFMALFVLIFMPVFVTFALFVRAGIFHLCLLLLGATERDFWATFRAVGYSTGPLVFQVIPFLGGVVGPIWELLLVIIGLKVVHRTTYGKSLLAVFLPTLVCCGAFLFLIAAIGGGVAAALLKTVH